MTTPGTFVITDPLPTGTTLLEASAGTGKTWTIASLVTRYVAEGRARLDEMLVVTFGRAASQELRERVREQLVAAERALAAAASDGGAEPPGPTSSPTSRIRPLLPLLLAGDDEDRRARRRRLREALADFDAATIATTHQFCQLVLASLGVAGDTDASAHLVEDLDDLLLEVVDDLYVRGFARDDEQPAFSRSDALVVARAAVGDPQARLRPADAASGSLAARRWRFAGAVRAELDRRKRRLGVLSYDDLLSQLASALEAQNAPARQRMRLRWKVVLVDEFQDTDPVQWQVLDRAFSGHSDMVLIGDPKQAIYAFRGGDVVTYLEAAHTATTRATLGLNQRSDAGLLSALQVVLEGAALGHPEIVVRDVQAQHQQPRLVGAPRPAPFRLRLVGRTPFGKSGTAGVGIADLRAHVGTDLARDIGALLSSGATFDGRPLEARDVAVLCRTGNQCAVAQRSLRAHGIPAVVAGSGSVFATEAAQDWLTVLEAMEQPHRTARVRAASLTSFFGRTPAELAVGGDVVTDADAEMVRDWADLLRQRGVAAVLEAATASGSFAERVLGRTDGERQLTDLRHAGEALHQVAVRDGLGLVALVGWLRRQMTQDQLSISSERARRLDSDVAAVQILTIHASKGLQFPVVYLPSASDTHLWPPDVPRYHDDEGARCIDVGSPQAGAGSLAAAAAEDAGEELRLLYVALTRAQSQVVTWWLPSGHNTKASPLHRMLFGRAPGEASVPDTAALPTDADALTRALTWQQAGGPSVEPADHGAESEALPSPEVGVLGVRSFTRWVDREWRRASYTSLSAAAAAADGGATTPTPGSVVPQVLPPASEPEDPPRDDEPDLPPARAVSTGPVGAAPRPAPAGAVRSPMADLPVGATFGSLVHAVLEHADPAARDHGGDWRAELRHHVTEQLVRWPVALDVDLLTDALVAVCDSPLGPLAPTTLRQIGRADRMCELDFELPLAGGDRRPAAGASAPSGPATARGTVRDLAALLRAHLPVDDPLRPYADVVDHPAYEAATLRGYLTGSLDVVLRVGGRYVVVDYKTNWLGDPDAELTADAYGPDRLAEAMGHSSYPLQALLYAVVLHRFLRWRLPGYAPEEHLGGVLYLYVRGMCGPTTPLVDGHPCGVFAWRPPVDLVEAVSDLLDGADVGRAVS